MTLLEPTLGGIRPVRRDLERVVRARLDRLTKPPGSLGRLEDLAVRVALAQNTERPAIGRKRIVTFAADHGVAVEGVSAYPQKVTAQMVRNMVGGGAAINVLAAHVGAEVVVVDIGVADPLADAPGLVRRKICPGTRNIAVGPAMNPDEVNAAVETGIELAMDAARDGVTLLGTGEMGIANTTSAAALFAALLPCPVDEIVGRGTGIDDETLARKRWVIERALAANAEASGDPLAALAALGGLEIAGICGLILGAAVSHVPVVIDGFISSSSALVACRMNAAAGDYLVYAHLSDEAGHAVFFERIGVLPLLSLGMRLGEGTGAALGMSVIEASVRLLQDMATFEAAEVSGPSDE